MIILMPWVLAGGFWDVLLGTKVMIIRHAEVLPKSHHLLNNDDLMVETTWNVCV